jgi:hypothetical protein
VCGCVGVGVEHAALSVCLSVFLWVRTHLHTPHARLDNSICPQPRPPPSNHHPARAMIPHPSLRHAAHPALSCRASPGSNHRVHPFPHSSGSAAWKHTHSRTKNQPREPSTAPHLTAPSPSPWYARARAGVAHVPGMLDGRGIDSRSTRHTPRAPVLITSVSPLAASRARIFFLCVGLCAFASGPRAPLPLHPSSSLGRAGGQTIT